MGRAKPEQSLGLRDYGAGLMRVFIGLAKVRRHAPRPGNWDRSRREAPTEYGPLCENPTRLHERHREALVDAFLLSTPHPALRATFPSRAGEGDPAPRLEVFECGSPASRITARQPPPSPHHPVAPLPIGLAQLSAQ